MQILEAAKILFAENGYRGVSTKKIAKTAEVNEVTIFRIFGSKKRLFEETFEHFLFRPNFSSLFNIMDLSLEEMLTNFGEVLHNFFVGNLPLIKMEIQNQEIEIKKSLKKFPNEVKEVLAIQFQQHKKLSDEAAVLQAVCYMTALHGLCLNLYIFQSLTDDMKFADCLAVLVQNFK